MANTLSNDFGEFRWVKPPQQARSQASLSRILDAAAEVIAKHGFERATIAEIVRSAKSSVGVFYDRFKDKDALLDCLHDRFCQESYATADEALDPQRWIGATSIDIATTLTNFLVQIYREQRGLLKVFIVRCATEQRAAERGAQLMNYITNKFAALMRTHEPVIRHPDPEFAVEFSLRIAYSTLDSITIFDEVPLEPIKLDDPKLAPELARSMLGYMGIQADLEQPKRKRRTALAR